MELIYGTQNRAKIASMQQCLYSLWPDYPLTIRGVEPSDGKLPVIEESGNDPLENACLKASAYYRALKRPVFSLDSGLYFDGLPAALQPGLNVRRVNGQRLTDEEMTDYYAKLANRYGGRLTARYVNGICLVMAEGAVYSYMGEDIATERFYLVDKPHAQREEGFPLDTLSVQMKSGQYYYDLDRQEKETAWHTRQGFCDFFKRSIFS